MMRKLATVLIAFLASTALSLAQGILLEAESFTDKGGWLLDQTSMDIMGSPYIMAHGMGVPVADAQTSFTVNEKGAYTIYVRTYNWTSPWTKAEGPGKFQIVVNGKRLGTVGSTGNCWEWQKAGSINLKEGVASIRLHDLTGFNGRCDAIYITNKENDIPSSDIKELQTWRDKLIPKKTITESYDLVVAGGGIAGICAAVTAARLGMKVALVNDRPILGGNNSSEIRVHLGGFIESGPYKQLGNLIKEFGPLNGGNAQPADNYEDWKKAKIVADEKNITLFANYHVNGAKVNGGIISSVSARHIESGDILVLNAPLFADCTGDGAVGYLAGAHYLMGREAKDEYFEDTAPEIADKMTMGSSVQWYSEKKGKTVSFPRFEYGLKFNDDTCERVPGGEWTWETGMNHDQITEIERIRDYGLMVVFSNWSYLKNDLKDNKEFQDRQLGWVAHIAGKRESRRLLGDYIMKEGDIKRRNLQEDGTAATTWSVDLHYPDLKNNKDFPDNEFKSYAVQDIIHPYPIPYRCFYSRNINNLFMAGRDISVTHVALGTVRVMRTTGMMGEVVGMAASICKRHGALPRAVYQDYFGELKQLMQKGIGKQGLPNNQTYNVGGTLGE